MIEVVGAGLFATVQDRGRYGYASLGVPRAGAFDRAAAELANRLVGNAPEAALLEVTMGGVDLTFHTAATIAVTGAPCGGRYEHGAAATIPAGHRLSMSRAVGGLRTYVAVRGGISVDAVLGSRSTDTLSGLGPAPLAAGDRLPIGDLVAGQVSDAVVGSRPVPRALRIVPGPRDDWFSPDALEVLTSTEWTVRAESDRVGLRLDGPRLARTRAGELPSEPLLPGAVQIPPDGRPILFGPDAPVTGGYPVLAVVRDTDLDAAAQLPPGQGIRFTVSELSR